MAPQICPANFGITTQCPQIYVYIVSIITTMVLFIRYGMPMEAMFNGVMGIIMGFILMGINFCSWNFQWVTYLFTFIWITVIITNITLIFSKNGDKIFTMMKENFVNYNDDKEESKCI